MKTYSVTFQDFFYKNCRNSPELWSTIVFVGNLFLGKNKKARKIYKMEMSKILELKKLKITITERFILMDDRMLDLARLRILRLEENSFGIEDKGFNLSYRKHS